MSLPVLLVLSSMLQPPQPTTFRARVEVVQVDVFVGREGRAVEGLGADDFELYDNGVLQEVQVVSTSQVPLSALMVLDTSRSVQGRKLRYLKEAAQSFLKELEDDDRVGVVRFDSRLASNGELTADAGDMRDRLERMEGTGFTSIHDGLYAGLQMAASEERSLIVLFTDGRDTFSWLTEGEVLDVVRRSNPVIEIVATSLYLANTREGWQQSNQTRLFLEEVAQLSGGTFRSAAASDELEDIFREIVAEMKARYVLTYDPTGVDDADWHELEVKVEGHDVKARRGYFSSRE